MHDLAAASARLRDAARRVEDADRALADEAARRAGDPDMAAQIAFETFRRSVAVRRVALTAEVADLRAGQAAARTAAALALGRERAMARLAEAAATAARRRNTG